MAYHLFQSTSNLGPYVADNKGEMGYKNVISDLVNGAFELFYEPLKMSWIAQKEL